MLDRVLIAWQFIERLSSDYRTRFRAEYSPKIRRNFVHGARKQRYAARKKFAVCTQELALCSPKCRRNMLCRRAKSGSYFAFRDEPEGGRVGGSMARRRGWSLDYNCSGKPEARNYATYRMENCAPLFIRRLYIHSGMHMPPVLLQQFQPYVNSISRSEKSFCVYWRLWTMMFDIARARGDMDYFSKQLYLKARKS